MIGRNYAEDRGRSWNGRWPANVILDEEAGEILDKQVGPLHGAGNKTLRNAGDGKESASVFGVEGGAPTVLYDRGGNASRFFYCAKASKRERGEGNNHPTVKPLSLLTYLIKLVCPPEGVVLDPFLGSGSTALAAQNLGRKFIGIEKEEKYVEIAKARLGLVAA